MQFQRRAQRQKAAGLRSRGVARARVGEMGKVAQAGDSPVTI
jgi:hypothetical protein